MNDPTKEKTLTCYDKTFSCSTEDTEKSNQDLETNSKKTTRTKLILRPDNTFEVTDCMCEEYWEAYSGKITREKLMKGTYTLINNCYIEMKCNYLLDK